MQDKKVRQSPLQTEGMPLHLVLHINWIKWIQNSDKVSAPLTRVLIRTQTLLS